MKYVDAVVIGGGVLGCFAARNLLRWNMSVLLIEKEEDICRGITKANSAIVYSGCDNKPGSLKAELTVRANGRFDTLCRNLDVSFHRCGSLAAAVGPCGEQVLQEKYEQGKRNGVPGMQLLSGEEARKMEPYLSADVTMALYVPGTGTVNPWQLGIAAYENALQNGCEAWLSTEVTGIQKSEQGYLVKCKGRNINKYSSESKMTNDSDKTERSIQEEVSEKIVVCRAVINCAGLSADKVQEMLFPPSIRLFPDGAGFLVLDRNCPGPVHIVFQEMEDGKGITAIPAVEGNLLLASPKRNQEGEPFSTDHEVLGKIKQMTAELLPEMDCSRVIRSFGAVRPNPHRVKAILADGKERNEAVEKAAEDEVLKKKENIRYLPDGKNIGSFSIEHPEDGFYSLIGIKTPGLTCADELGKYLAERTAAYLGTGENPQFDPVRKRIPSIHRMTPEERESFVNQHPEYGEVICRCEDITKGEILEAVQRGAKTAEGVKRRVGTGMGRCQGSRCSQKIERLIKECNGNMISLS